MAIKSASGSLVILDAHASPIIFWKGVKLTEIKRITLQSDGDDSFLRLRVENTPNFDVQYAEMQADGIIINRK